MHVPRCSACHRTHNLCLLRGRRRCLRPPAANSIMERHQGWCALAAVAAASGASTAVGLHMCFGLVGRRCP
jgi:hypothetical protein